MIVNLSTAISNMIVIFELAMQWCLTLKIRVDWRGVKTIFVYEQLKSSQII